MLVRPQPWHSLLTAYKVDYVITFLKFELYPHLFALLKRSSWYTDVRDEGYVYLPREQFNH
jgi:hypothetical protein